MRSEFRVSRKSRVKYTIKKPLWKGYSIRSDPGNLIRNIFAPEKRFVNSTQTLINLVTDRGTSDVQVTCDVDKNEW